MTELACKTLVFHFNKAHLQDPEIPMWVLKANGETYYVNHVDAMIPWSTKETPDNEHTKGSLKFKNAYVTIDEDNNAKIGKLSAQKKKELKESSYVKRYIAQDNITGIQEYLSSKKMGKSLMITATCSTPSLLIEINNEKDNTWLVLMFAEDLRGIKENEQYWKFMDKISTQNKLEKHGTHNDTEDREVTHYEYS